MHFLDEDDAPAGSGVPLHLGSKYGFDPQLRLCMTTSHCCDCQRAAGATQVYMAAAGTLAKLHSLAPEEAGLGDYGPRAGYCKRQVAQHWVVASDDLHATLGMLLVLELRPPRRLLQALGAPSTCGHEMVLTNGSVPWSCGSSGLPAHSSAGMPGPARRHVMSGSVGRLRDILQPASVLYYTIPHSV